MDDDFDVFFEDIKEYERICLDQDGQIKENTRLLLHVGEVIGQTQLNEKTFETWVSRILLLKATDNTVAVFDGNEPWWPTELDLRSHFGLNMGVDELTDAEFEDWLMRTIKHRAALESLPRHYH